jgi:hypothetical protein
MTRGATGLTMIGDRVTRREPTVTRDPVDRTGRDPHPSRKFPASRAGGTGNRHPALSTVPSIEVHGVILAAVGSQEGAVENHKTGRSSGPMNAPLGRKTPDSRNKRQVQPRGVMPGNYNPNAFAALSIWLTTSLFGVADK